MEELKKKGSSVDGHKLVMTLIFIAVTAVIFLAIGYVAGKNEVDNQQTALVEDTATTTTTALKSTTATTSATADETASWKTYTNEEYGFSFKYPGDYRLEENVTPGEDNSNIVFNVAGVEKDSAGDWGIMIIVEDSNLESSIQALKDRNSSAEYSESTKSISGKSWIAEYNGVTYEYFSENNGYTYRIGWAIGDTNRIEDQILSTFQFTK
ncbi:MAG: hypothetical protein BWY43_00625 [candidate division WS2 bacterium ADurb.Bin280]|uniref:Uncharacterized protein n=1 Tax=candidate division WS2 bacterium ADurb.Bin280 TaxID=1852829 RepID=A0A1V5SC98_9BACT|nr:MAG: hypothetical protein BWY43_00625 [candidate division WS2 bacterium ADurb.Bin280]